MKKKLHALYGLKWNPFLPDVPAESLFESAPLASFRERIRNLSTVGGYALLVGDPGTGKSGALRLITRELATMPDVVVGVLTRPQASIFDFYRELGELYGLSISPSNRWGGTKVLRDRWMEHVESTGVRPVLVIDEAQEMRSEVLNEVRLLASHMLDSELLLAVVFAGDQRLAERLRSRELVALGSRIRVRLLLGNRTSDELREILDDALAEAGGPRLLTDALVQLVTEHAGGNLRTMMNTAAELLEIGLAREAQKLDEKLFFELYGDLGRELAEAGGKRRGRGRAR